MRFRLRTEKTKILKIAEKSKLLHEGVSLTDTCKWGPALSFQFEFRNGFYTSLALSAKLSFVFLNLFFLFVRHASQPYRGRVSLVRARSARSARSVHASKFHVMHHIFFPSFPSARHLALLCFCVVSAQAPCDSVCGLCCMHGWTLACLLLLLCTNFHAWQQPPKTNVLKPGGV